LSGAPRIGRSCLPLLIRWLPSDVVRILALISLFILIGPLSSAASNRGLVLRCLIWSQFPLLLTTTVFLIRH